MKSKVQSWLDWFYRGRFIGPAFLCLFLVGCSPLERNAYNAFVAANASIKQLKTSHPECATGTASTTCTLIAKATAVKDSLIDAAEVYCAGPNFDSVTAGGSCDAPKKGTAAYAQAAPKLQAALTAWNQIAKDLSGVK